VRGERHQKLIDALETAAAQHGLELVDVELSGTGRLRVVRIFLDREGGIGIDELAKANLWVDATVEANEPYTGAYTLEVSSPGIDRPLRTLAHFARFAGEEARLVTEPLNGRGKWTGVVVGIEGEDVLLEVDGETRRIPHRKIRHAHLKGRIDFNKERKEEREERTEHVI
jgi:ribosome maturation factor RimP